MVSIRIDTNSVYNLSSMYSNSANDVGSNALGVSADLVQSIDADGYA